MYNDIGLHIVVQYEKQATQWSEDRREHYYTVHAKAYTVTFAEKAHTDESYEKANIEMIDGTDRLIIFSVDTNVKCHAERAATVLEVQTQIIDLSNILQYE